MSLSTIARRARNADIEYVLGRFQTVRSLYGRWRSATDGPPEPPGLEAAANTLFPGVDIDQVTDAIKQDAVFIGLNLPDETVQSILAFAKAEELHAIYDPHGPTFLYRDVTNGVAADGRPMPIGGIRDPARCAAVKAVIEDPVLNAIVQRYLGHKPRRVMTILDWSFGSQMSAEERRRLRHHVIDYHYDVGGFNFVYASFYITDTDRYSGAHVMMKGSHRKKPLRMLFGSARAEEDAVHRQFGRENELVIEGPAGTGFVQDTSCYHRASPPTRGDRLMLAVRFIN